MKIELLTCIETTKQYTVKLTDKMIIDLVRKHLTKKVSDDAKVSVEVPGGGDWSNMTLNIDVENQLYVTWSEKVVEDIRE